MPYVDFLKKKEKSTLSLPSQVVREVAKNGLLKYYFSNFNKNVDPKRKFKSVYV